MKKSFILIFAVIGMITLSGFKPASEHEQLSLPQEVIVDALKIIGLNGGDWIDGAPTKGLGVAENGAVVKIPMIPSQTGNAGKFLTTDGTNLIWASPLANVSVTYPSRTLNTPFTPSKTSIGIYSVQLEATNPLLAGSSTATAKVQKSTNGGSTWTDVSTNSASSTVTLTVSVQIKQGQTACLVAPLESGVLYRINTSTVGTATVSLINQSELTF